MSSSGDPRPNPGFETTDADPRPLVVFLVGLVALIGVSLLASSWLEDLFAGSGETATSHPMEEARPTPTGPLLQATPGDEAREVARQERELLASYGWIDRENGLVRVPIDVAIERVLARGLPWREAPGAGEGDSR